MSDVVSVSVDQKSKSPSTEEVYPLEDDTIPAVALTTTTAYEQLLVKQQVQADGQRPRRRRERTFGGGVRDNPARETAAAEVARTTTATTRLEDPLLLPNQTDELNWNDDDSAVDCDDDDDHDPRNEPDVINDGDDDTTTRATKGEHHLPSDLCVDRSTSHAISSRSSSPTVGHRIDDTNDKAGDETQFESIETTETAGTIDTIVVVQSDPTETVSSMMRGTTNNSHSIHNGKLSTMTAIEVESTPVLDAHAATEETLERQVPVVGDDDNEASPCTAENMSICDETLDLNKVLASTDALFAQVQDKNTVTVKDIVTSLVAEYQCRKLSKSVKAAVKKRLTDLVSGTANRQDKDIWDKPESNLANSGGQTSREDGTINLDDVLSSTDALFDLVEDKTAVTVKDIITSLLAEYQCLKFSKCIKAAIRQRLVDLSTASTVNQEADDENNVDSDLGDSDRSDESDAENNRDQDYDSDDEHTRSRSNRVKSKSRAVPRHTTGQPSRVRSTKASQTKLALRVHAEQRRKRRLEELRVRNEELLVHQSARDQERATQIAAKFETNTDDLRNERLEKRLDLLQKLNQKRIHVCSVSESVDVVLVVAGSPDAGPATVNADANPTFAVPDVELMSVAADVNSEDDDDDDEMELEIEGDRTLSFNSVAKPCLLNNTRSRLVNATGSGDVLSLLDKADASQLHNEKRKPTNIMSPGRTSINARAALKHKLKNKQRSMGNLWLARELGYTTEQEHLQECLNHVNTLRQQVLVKEMERVQANERAALRQKILRDEEVSSTMMDIPEETGVKSENGVCDSDGEYEDAENDGDDDDDEELAMAKELEKEEPTDANESEETSDTMDKNVLDHEKTSENYTEAAMNLSRETTSLSVIDRDRLLCDLNDHQGSQISSNPSTGGGEDEEKNGSSPFEETQLQPPLPSHRIDDIQIDQAEEDEATSPTEVSPDACDNKEESVEANEDKEGFADSSGEDNLAAINPSKSSSTKLKGPRNSAWKAMLQKDAENAKKKKRSSLVEEEADEEEEEEVAGLEDFGFVVQKKKANDDEDDHGDFDEDDLEHVVDDVSDDEGDEEAGKNARKEMEAAEEKKRHMEIIGRMRDGYDGRRGGIAGGGAGARGVHRFDQLVAADNREDARQLGLLNDDEIDSDNEGNGPKAVDDEIEDETALLDQMLKDRFLHRSSAVEEEVFSDDDDDAPTDEACHAGNDNDEELEQERLAKRFSKRARMHRLLENHGHEEEFSQALLLDEDTTMKLELQRMKDGLVRKRSQSSSRSESMSATGIQSSVGASTSGHTLTTSLFNKGGSLAIALQASRRTSTFQKTRTSFVRSSESNTASTMSSFEKCTTQSNHAVFHSSSVRSQMSSSSCSSRGVVSSNGGSSRLNEVQRGNGTSHKRSVSLFSHLAVDGFQKKARNH